MFYYYYYYSLLCRKAANIQNSKKSNKNTMLLSPGNQIQYTMHTVSMSKWAAISADISLRLLGLVLERVVAITRNNTLSAQGVRGAKACRHGLPLIPYPHPLPTSIAWCEWCYKTAGGIRSANVEQTWFSPNPLILLPFTDHLDAITVSQVSHGSLNNIWNIVGHLLCSHGRLISWIAVTRCPCCMTTS